MSIEYRVGDVYDRMREIPDNSIDLVVTSPPFLALRSYLPADHPDKHKEIGSEATPADFIDTLLALTAEFGRVLAPHGSICVELGDTYAGGGQTGWHRSGNEPLERYRNVGAIDSGVPQMGVGWPLPKSLTGIPTLYPWSLAYNRNLLTGMPSPAGQWRIRNVIVWARPNPPVGALGDKFRPATSYITVACRSAKRYFDLDAVRTTPTQDPATYSGNGYSKGNPEGIIGNEAMPGNPAGAPPLDWHTEEHPEDGDWLWKLSTQPYAGSHYATFPLTLPKRLIMAMCPQKVCVVCGRPSERIVGEATYIQSRNGSVPATLDMREGRELADPLVKNWSSEGLAQGDNGVTRQASTIGWTECNCDYIDACGQKWRTGVVLDPFAGSGTTLEAAQIVGRSAIGIDLDPRNADLARNRVGMFMTINEGAA